MGKLQPPALFLTGHFCRSVTKSCPALCNPVNCTTPGFPVLHYLPRVCLNLCPLSQWHHPTISSSVALFSSCPQSFPASESFQIRWPKYWSLSFNITPSKEYSGLISFKIDWFDLLAFQGTLKSLLQHHSSKTSILWHSAFFMAQFSDPYMTTGKAIALFIQNLCWQSDVSAY